MPTDPSTSSLDKTLRDFVPDQKVFSRYTLTRILGRGGMGIVWLAHDDQLDREVALKFLPEIIVHDRAVVEDLKRETKRCLELTHKNIIRIHDFVQDRISACISMEYVDGDTLSNLRSDKATRIFEPDEIKPWLSQLCEALDYAHNHARIIHRDLKPSNLMISKRGQLKIADFGIARSLTESVSMLTHSQSASGTLVYMSPQQLDGMRATHLDDIYSVGATIYELLTSKPPFYSGDINRQIHERIPPSMVQRRADLGIEGNPIPKNWEETIAACLAKDPTQRPQSVIELGPLGVIVQTAPLHELPSQHRVGADHADPTLSSTTRPPKDLRNISLLLFAALVLGGALSWFLTQQRHNFSGKSVKKQVAPSEAPIGRPAATNQQPNRPSDILIIARANREIARCEKYRATYLPEPNSTIWILTQPSDELFATFQPTMPVGKAVFSKDGDYFAYSEGSASAGTRIRLYRVEPLPIDIRIAMEQGEPWKLMKSSKTLPSDADIAHLYQTPVEVLTEPLRLIFDVYADYSYQPTKKKERVQTHGDARFQYRVDANALEIMHSPTTNQQNPTSSSSSELTSPALSNTKKLFAGTWEGTLRGHPSDPQLAEMASRNKPVTFRLLINEAETQVTEERDGNKIPSSNQLHWVRKGDRVLAWATLDGKFITTITLQPDGKSAVYMSKFPDGTESGTLRKKN